MVTTAGLFKRTPLAEFPVQGRYGGGVAAMRLAQKSGAVVDALVAEPADEFFSAPKHPYARLLLRAGSNTRTAGLSFTRGSPRR